MAMDITTCEAGVPPDREKFAGLFGPGQGDQSIRQVIQICWMVLPSERKNMDNLEREIRRIVDRALKDFREDQEQFSRKK